MEAPKTEVIISSGSKHLVRYVVGTGTYLIGRDNACAIKVEAESVSRRHAQLVVDDHDWAIKDVGSTYGTYLGGQPITESTKILPKQKIKLGTVMMELQRLQSEPVDDKREQWRYEVERFLPARLLREHKYQGGKKIAQGGMGTILTTREAGIRRTVVMKVLRGHDSTDRLLRFIEEAQITGQLDHPGIVPVYDLGVDAEHQPFYTMKYVRGVTLREVLGKLEAGDPETLARYPLTSLLTVFQKICDALAFAHSKHVIHRDLKPDNIMIGHFGEVLVMDWGLAKLLQIGSADPSAHSAEDAEGHSVILSVRRDEGEEGRTMSGTIMGTPNYMAPEQAEGAIEKIDARTDIFALGGILYHMLALQMPFSGKTLDEVLDKVMRCEIAPLTNQKRPHLPGGRVPSSLATIVMKAMAQNQEARYQQVQDFQLDLAAYQNGLAITAGRAKQVQQLTAFVKNNKLAVLTILTLLLALGGVFTFSMVQTLAEHKRAKDILTELRTVGPNLQDPVVAEQFWKTHNLAPLKTAP